MDAVPEPEPRFQSLHGGHLGLDFLLRVSGTEAVHQLPTQFPVLVAIQLDVTVQVVPEGRQGTRESGIQAGDELPEQVGNEILASVGEGGGDLMDASGGDHRNGVPDKFLGTGGATGAVHRLVDPEPLAQVFEQPVHGLGVRSGLTHGAPVQLEVAGRVSRRVEVALLPEHHLIDHPSEPRIPHRTPRKVDAGQPALQGLEQGHEVPDGIDVVFHENTQVSQGS